MKKRILTWLLAVGMLASLLTVPAGAANATRFSDVADNYTATAIETLRLMGVLDGYSDGTFRPNAALTRAQFCKMAVYAMDGSEELGRYSTVTIFPDVKPSFWASSYINMAAKKGIIAGFADGKFKPNQTVTAGQAVTILMRGLGYKDENMGGVWPQGYMAEAKTCGLLKSTGITSAYSALTRGQAAKLFLNLFEAKRGTGEGAVVLFSFTPEKDEVYLTNLDAGKGTLTAGGKPYTMAHPVTSTSLIGSKGKVVLNGDGEILTFLPVTGGSGISNAAVIIGANGSAAGLESLAGTSSYNIYKNGLPATVGDLKRYDVATWSASTGSILVCDTRVSVYYENCAPSVSAPTTITVLDGMELNVLPTATDDLAKLKPGKQIVLLLTADGQVAGAMDADSASARSNAIGVVSDDGTLSMICGGTLLSLGKKGTGYAGKAVNINSVKNSTDGGAKLSLTAVSGGAGGDLNIRERTLGGKKLADSVLVFNNGEQVALSQLGQTTIGSGRIVYARTNYAGQVDLIVLNDSLTSDMAFGRIKSITEGSGAEEPNTIVFESNGETITIQGNYGVRTGDFMAVSKKTNDLGVRNFYTLTKLTNISSSSWIDNSAVNYGGRTYEVPSSVQCYNADTGTWFASLDAARDYGGTMNLYVYDGVIRIVEVRG